MEINLPFVSVRANLVLLCLFGNALSEPRTSKCVIVLLPEVNLVLVIVDILEGSSKKDRWPVKGTDRLERTETSQDSLC